MINEFKEFIAKGNALDLAVGVVIGSAFSAIVNSIVNDIIMPVVGVLVGGIDFSNLTITFKDATIKYGLFIQNVINFFIIAFCMFLVIRTINKINEQVKKNEEKLLSKLGKAKEEKKEEVKKEEVPENIKLLKEINKNLKALNKKQSK